VKFIIYTIIIILLICYAPAIPYESKLKDKCITTIEYKSVLEWSLEKYKEINAPVAQ